MTERWQDEISDSQLAEAVRIDVEAYGFAVNLQLKRIFTDAEPNKEYSAKELAPDAILPLIEFHFLATSLWRIRRALELLEGSGRFGSVSTTLVKFNELLPDLKDIRDTLEHCDERLKGRARSNSRQLVTIKWANMKDCVFGLCNKLVWLNAGIVEGGAATSSQPLLRKNLELNIDSIRIATRLAVEFAHGELQRAYKQ